MTIHFYLVPNFTFVNPILHGVVLRHSGNFAFTMLWSWDKAYSYIAYYYYYYYYYY